jgi:hypothetical protein
VPAAQIGGLGGMRATMQWQSGKARRAGGAFAACLALMVGGQGRAADEVADVVERLPAPEAVADFASSMRLDELPLLQLPEVASSGEWFSSSGWYGGAEVLFFDRSRIDRQTVGEERNAATGALVDTFTTTPIPFDLAPGARITIGDWLGRDDLDRDRSLELVYYGGFSFFQRDSRNALPGDVIITPLDPTSPFFVGTTYETTHHTLFNSLEGNFRLARRLGRDQLVMSPNGTWMRRAPRGFLSAFLIGTRVVNLNDSFTLATAAPDRAGSYAVDAQNWLWGLNVGGELVSRNEFFFWGLRGRATPSMNFAATQQAATGTAPAEPPLDQAGAATRFTAGFVGDLSLFAGWQITPRFAITAGWDFLWVAGLATAPRQFNLTNTRTDPIDPGGQIFLNGLALGCEGRW